MGKQKSPTRVFQGQVEIHHDLFVLEPAEMKKNLAYLPGQAPDLVSVVHQHFFHTVDSDGRKQTQCSAVGGHFHEVEIVEPASEGKAPVVKFGPAMTYMPVKDEHGRIKRTAVPCKYDSHTHEVRYLRSNLVKMRSASPEVAAVQAQWNKPAPSGVAEGL
jgi:hypothetical protein